MEVYEIQEREIEKRQPATKLFKKLPQNRSTWDSRIKVSTKYLTQWMKTDQGTSQGNFQTLGPNKTQRVFHKDKTGQPPGSGNTLTFKSRKTMDRGCSCRWDGKRILHPDSPADCPYKTWTEGHSSCLRNSKNKQAQTDWWRPESKVPPNHGAGISFSSAISSSDFRQCDSDGSRSLRCQGWNITQQYKGTNYWSVQ